MRVKRVYLLLIFIFSLFMTNIYNPQNKPPLLEYYNAPNIIILAEHNSNFQEIIPLDFSKTEIHLVGIEAQRDCVVEIFSIMTLLSILPILNEKVFGCREPRGLNGIVFWDRKRVLRN